MQNTSQNDQLRLVRSLFPDLAETLDTALTEHGPAEAAPIRAA
ncbi:hypothetical protein [Leucobacter coleopterorum]|nr:hypothetical protein [Leucobacter coleopterorum]